MHPHTPASFCNTIYICFRCIIAEKKKTHTTKTNKQNPHQTTQTDRLPCCPIAQTPNPQLYWVCLCASLPVALQALLCLSSSGVFIKWALVKTQPLCASLPSCTNVDFRQGCLLCQDTEMVSCTELYPALRRVVFKKKFSPPHPLPFPPLKNPFVWRIKDL